MIVALGAAVFMVAALRYADGAFDNTALRLDPTRIIAGGIGFLGAGAIVEARGNVRGMTTAAGIWVAAAVGTACGMGTFRIATPSLVLAVLILAIVERWSPCCSLPNQRTTHRRNRRGREKTKEQATELLIPVRTDRSPYYVSRECVMMSAGATQ